ncbi:MAG: DUF3908 family protein [Bacillota bacterium]
MYKEMTLDNFIQYSAQSGRENGNRFLVIVDFIEKYLNKEDVKVFYPKNLFVDEKLVEIYFFKNDKVVIVKETDFGMKSEIINFNQIRSLTMDYQGEYSPVTLKIEFNNGVKIELSDQYDTNSVWSNRFTHKIENVFKLLS